jgi:hypothetical protein
MFRSGALKQSLSPFSLALAAVLLLAAAGAAFSLDVYGSKEGDYSVRFPSPPEENIQTTSAYRILTHALNEDNVIYIAGHGDFVAPLDPEQELNANIDNYVKEIHGKVVWRAPLAFGRGDKSLQAREFTYESDRLIGRGIVVVEGLSSYLAAASALKPHNREAVVNAFLRSFKLEPAK